MNLLSNIRFYVLTSSILFSLAVYIFILQTIPEGTLQNIRLTQIYALTAVSFLYFALLPDGLAAVFPRFPFRTQYTKARRAIGVSAFYFATLHASFAFFGQLGGFPGLFFLSDKYLLAISLSFTALVILSLMAATSFDFMVAKLTFPRWKMLHRFVYLAATLIAIHALMLGTHFANLSEFIPQIFSVALAILLLLEANRFDGFLNKILGPKIPADQPVSTPTSNLPRFGPTVVIVMVVIVWFVLTSFGSTGGTPSLGIHSQHIQIAKDAQQNAASTNNINPTLVGDKTKRYSVSFLHPEQVEASKDVKLQFLVNDASSGNPVNFFTKVYEKPLHLIIVDDSLQFFTHLHPDQIVGGFEITTQFPHYGSYRLYQNFQPTGAIEQQTAFSLNVVANSKDKLASLPIASISSQPVDTNLTGGDFVTKTFGDYSVSLKFPTPLKASEMSIGSQKLTFTIKDAKTGQGVTNLKPYLAAFGHLVMINQETYDYLHVHPNILKAPLPDQLGGPEVGFLPLGLYGPIKPGIYRVFAQFNPDSKLFTADFTVEVKP